MAIIIGLMVLGIIFVLLELFFLPGVSVASIIGLACFGGAVGVAYEHYGAMAGTITLAVTLVFCALAVWIFFRSKALDKMALHREIDSKLETTQGIQVGDRGLCLSRLAPMGKALINGQSYEVKSEGEMIDENTWVEVIAADKYQIIVKQIINS